MSKFRFYAIWLCLICIGVYILQVSVAGFEDLFVLNQMSFIEIWRFLTSIFLHGSIVHLFYNLFALALFGSILEKFIGGKKLLLVFFLSGIFANIIAVQFYPSSLGASGAIYGILGCLALLRPRMMVWAFGFPMPMFIAAILWILGALFGMFIPSDVGHIAHLSGIVIGFIVGIFLRKTIRIENPKNRKVKIPESYMRNWENIYMRN